MTARTIAACRAASEIVGSDALTATDALDHVAAVLSSTVPLEDGTYDTVVVPALAALVTERAGVALADDERRLADLTGCGPTFRTDVARDVAGAHFDGLAINRRREATRIIRRLPDRIAMAGGGASTREVLASAWGSVESTGSLNDVIGEFTAAGIDAERLCWAVITFETQRHTRLIWQQANKLHGSFPEHRPADLFGWGWQGLRVALRNFDPSLGFAFSTYACTRIAGAIRDGVRSENPVPKRLTTYQRKVARAEEDLTQALGRVPRLAEIAAELGETIDQLRILPRLSPSASIEEMRASAGDRGTEIGWLVDASDPADRAVDAVLADVVAKALDHLPADEATAVRLLVMEKRTPTEARLATGATARQLRQRRERGLATLKDHLRDWRPEDAIEA